MESATVDTGQESSQIQKKKSKKEKKQGKSKADKKLHKLKKKLKKRAKKLWKKRKNAPEDMEPITALVAEVRELSNNLRSVDNPDSRPPQQALHYGKGKGYFRQIGLGQDASLLGIDQQPAPEESKNMDGPLKPLAPKHKTFKFTLNISKRQKPNADGKGSEPSAKKQKNDDLDTADNACLFEPHLPQTPGVPATPGKNLSQEKLLLRQDPTPSQGIAARDGQVLEQVVPPPPPGGSLPEPAPPGASTASINPFMLPNNIDASSTLHLDPQRFTDAAHPSYGPSYMQEYPPQVASLLSQEARAMYPARLDGDQKGRHQPPSRFSRYSEAQDIIPNGMVPGQSKMLQGVSAGYPPSHPALVSGVSSSMEDAVARGMRDSTLSDLYRISDRSDMRYPEENYAGQSHQQGEGFPFDMGADNQPSVHPTKIVRGSQPKSTQKVSPFAKESVEKKAAMAAVLDDMDKSGEFKVGNDAEPSRGGNSAQFNQQGARQGSIGRQSSVTKDTGIFSRFCKDDARNKRPPSCELGLMKDKYGRDYSRRGRELIKDTEQRKEERDASLEPGELPFDGGNSAVKVKQEPRVLDGLHNSRKEREDWGRVSLTRRRSSVLFCHPSNLSKEERSQPLRRNPSLKWESFEKIEADGIPAKRAKLMDTSCPPEPAQKPPGAKVPKQETGAATVKVEAALDADARICQPSAPAVQSVSCGTNTDFSTANLQTTGMQTQTIELADAGCGTEHKEYAEAATETNRTEYADMAVGTEISVGEIAVQTGTDLMKRYQATVEVQTHIATQEMDTQTQGVEMVSVGTQAETQQLGRLAVPECTYGEVIPEEQSEASHAKDNIMENFSIVEGISMYLNSINQKGKAGKSKGEPFDQLIKQGQSLKRLGDKVRNGNGSQSNVYYIRSGVKFIEAASELPPQRAAQLLDQTATLLTSIHQPTQQSRQPGKSQDLQVQAASLIIHKIAAYCLQCATCHLRTDLNKISRRLESNIRTAKEKASDSKRGSWGEQQGFEMTSHDSEGTVGPHAKAAGETGSAAGGYAFLELTPEVSKGQHLLKEAALRAVKTMELHIRATQDLEQFKAKVEVAKSDTGRKLVQCVVALGMSNTPADTANVLNWGQEAANLLDSYDDLRSPMQ